MAKKLFLIGQPDNTYDPSHYNVVNTYLSSQNFTNARRVNNENLFSYVFMHEHFGTQQQGFPNDGPPDLTNLQQRTATNNQLSVFCPAYFSETFFHHVDQQATNAALNITSASIAQATNTLYESNTPFQRAIYKTRHQWATTDLTEFNGTASLQLTAQENRSNLRNFLPETRFLTNSIRIFNTTSFYQNVIKNTFQSNAPAGTCEFYSAQANPAATYWINNTGYFYFNGYPNMNVVFPTQNKFIIKICADHTIWTNETLDLRPAAGRFLILVIQADTITPQAFFNSNLDTALATPYPQEALVPQPQDLQSLVGRIFTLLKNCNYVVFATSDIATGANNAPKVGAVYQHRANEPADQLQFDSINYDGHELFNNQIHISHYTINV